MGEPELTRHFADEASLTAAARAVAAAWHDGGLAPLIVALRGDLGSGKTTWVRAMLRGLGHDGRVPSPTYTLVEPYDVGGLEVLHLDLYRLAGDDELENLGMRDWLADSRLWLLVEWPDRAPSLAALADLSLELAVAGAAARRLTVRPFTARGQEAAHRFADIVSSIHT